MILWLLDRYWQQVSKMVITRIVSTRSWKIHLGFLPRRRVHWQWYPFWRQCPSFNHQIFPDSGPNSKPYFPPRIWYSATAKHQRYWCHMTFFVSCFWQYPSVTSRQSQDSFPRALTRWPAIAVVRNAQSSWVKALLELLFRVLADQGLHSNMNCQKTVLTHLVDPRKEATVQVLLHAHANPETLPDPQCPRVSSVYLRLPKKWTHQYWQPPWSPWQQWFPHSTIYQISVLAGFGLDLLASRAHSLPLEGREGRTSFVLQGLCERLPAVGLQDESS